MAGYYDPNKDYSAAIEAEKSKGANADQSVIQQLQTERSNKINDPNGKYGGNEPVMYGSNKTYSDLSANSGDYITNKANQNTINNAVSVTQSDTHKAAYEAALAGDWDRVGYYMNEIGMRTPSQYTDEAGATLYDMTEANAYLRNLTDMFDYDAKEYYDRRYDEVYGAGSAAAYDATGGAIKTYAELVEKLGAGEAQKMISQYSTGSAQTAIPGLSASVGLAGGGMNDMTQYLKDLYASNLEAELAALKSTYDSNIAELESQNDKIAEQYRAARNQTAAQNELQVQGMNERALATGLNTGTSGQLALAQNMAYQNNLGNLWAQEAQDKAESDRMMAEMLRDYNASVNQATATSNARLAEALYNEMIRQQELDAQNAKNELAALTNKAEMLAAFGDFSGYKALGYTDAEIAMMNDAYQQQMLLEQQERAARLAPKNDPDNQQVQAGLTEEEIAQAAAEFRKKSPQVYLDDRTIDYWLHDNGYSNESAQLFKAYLEKYGATYSRR